MYDWAISAFSTTVITVFLNPYLTSIATEAAGPGGFLRIFGLIIYAESYFEYVISLSVMLQVLILPLAGSIADGFKMKKPVLMLFTILGAAATTGMFFISDGRALLGGALLLIANISCGTAMVIYNSMLSEVAEEHERDDVSSRGFAIGYVGGGLLLLINLILFSYAERFGVTSSEAIRICLTSAGLWWGGFGFVAVLKMIEKGGGKRPKSLTLKNHFKQFGETFKDARNHPKSLLFLAAYLFFNDGVQAVIIVAGKFGIEEIGISMKNLTVVILVIQFVAYFGAMLFAKIAEKTTSKSALFISLFVWIGVVGYSYLFLETNVEFYVISCFIGLVLGGTQALSRSIYSRLIPKEKEAEYFSFYELSERGTGWMGPLAFALALQNTKSYRLAILSLLIFFVIGTVLLYFVKIPKIKQVEKAGEEES
jgi:UMF1 family MFS transporter